MTMATPAEGAIARRNETGRFCASAVIGDSLLASNSGRSFGTLASIVASRLINQRVGRFKKQVGQYFRQRSLLLFHLVVRRPSVGCATEPTNEGGRPASGPQCPAHQRENDGPQLIDWLLAATARQPLRQPAERGRRC